MFWDTGFVILTNVGAGKAWRNAPSVEVLSRVLSVGMAEYRLATSQTKMSVGAGALVGYMVFTTDG